MLCPSQGACPFTSRRSDWGSDSLSPWRRGRHYHNPGSLIPYGTFGSPSWGALAEIDDTMRHMERHFNRLHSFMDSAWRNFGRELGREDWCPSAGLESLCPEIVEDEGGEKKYRLNVHLGDTFAPENVKVNLKDRVMTIEAEHKTEDENSRVYKHVSRKFTLPPTLDLKEIHSRMGPHGVLHVEVPLPQQALPEPPKPTEIPIHLE